MKCVADNINPRSVAGINEVPTKLINMEEYTKKKTGYYVFLRNYK